VIGSLTCGLLVNFSLIINNHVNKKK
jgi:hypothetical protein